MVAAGIPGRDRLSTLEFPVLAKAPFSSGGIGTRRFEGLESLTAFLGEQPGDERWIVQTLIEGHDFAVNVLAQDGQILAATEQHAGFEFRDYAAERKPNTRCVNPEARILIMSARMSGLRASITRRATASQSVFQTAAPSIPQRTEMVAF